MLQFTKIATAAGNSVCKNKQSHTIGNNENSSNGSNNKSTSKSLEQQQEINKRFTMKMERNK